MAESKWTGSGSGALKGAGTGAMIGSVVPGVGTAIGAGIGASVGALGGALGSGSSWSEYDEENRRRKIELERRLNEGTLGLTDQERDFINQASFQREQQARDIADMERNRRMASAYGGAGTAFAQMQEAEVQAADAARLTGIEVARADMEEKQREEAEYWGRLATNSQREAEIAEKSAEERALLLSDLNEFMTSEITTGGIGGGTSEAAQNIAKQFGSDSSGTEQALQGLMDNPEMLAILMAAMDQGGQ